MSIVLLILIATVSVSIGETLLSAGMKQVGVAGGSGLATIISAITNPRVVIGTALMALYFGMYAHCLSIADISFVLPITALSYLFVAVLARFYLHETVTPTRWLGAIIIVIGVIVVGFGEKGS